MTLGLGPPSSVPSRVSGKLQPEADLVTKSGGGGKGVGERQAPIVYVGKLKQRSEDTYSEPLPFLPPPDMMASEA